MHFGLAWRFGFVLAPSSLFDTRFGFSVFSAAVGFDGSLCRRIVPRARPRYLFARRIEIEDALHGFSQHTQVLLERRGQGVQPMDRPHEKGHRLRRCDVLDAQGNDRDAPAHHPFDLAANLGRRIGVGRENQNHGSAMVERIDQRLAVFGAWPDIARSNPAPDAGVLQAGARCVGRGLVLARVADEDVEDHHAAPRMRRCWGDEHTLAQARGPLRITANFAAG